MMTIITLELPDELANQLQGFNLLEILKLGLAAKQQADNKEELELLPPGKLPPFEPAMPHEEWQEFLLTVSCWTAEELREIEEAREYTNQWRNLPYL